MDDVRRDKYLWAVRIFFKTRSDAAEERSAPTAMTVGGATCKHPSREVAATAT